MNDLVTGNQVRFEKQDIIVSLLLTIITCGIYALFWQAKQINVMNYLLKSEKYNFWTWFLLSIVTCGIYYVYHEYIMAEDICKLQIEKNIVNPATNLSLISLVLSIFGIPVVADAIQQSEINRIIEHEANS